MENPENVGTCTAYCFASVEGTLSRERMRKFLQSKLEKLSLNFSSGSVDEK